VAQTVIYKQAIRYVLEDIARTQLIGNVRFQPVFDDEHQTYQINAVGWDEGKPVLYIVVLLEIRDGLVWLHEDTTDYGVADALIRQGIPKEQIVLGWQRPPVRSDVVASASS
jgi:XisI protein